MLFTKDICMSEILKKPMWTAIHHDISNNLMFIWYADGTKEALRTKHRFFTPIRGEYNSSDCGMKDIYGNDMYEVITDYHTEMEIKSKHFGVSNYIAECDIDPRTRWLQYNYQDQKDIRFKVSDINICFLDIEVETEGKFPSASKAEYPINCVTIYFSKLDKYYTFGLRRELKQESLAELHSYNCEYVRCLTEKDLLEQLFITIGKSETDILTFWNGDMFDVPYIVKRAANYQIPLKLMCRLPDRFKSAYISKRDGSLVIAGTEVIDFLKLYRKYTFSERDNYKLDTIGEIECGEHKAPLENGYLTYKTDWDSFILYNFQDVRLMTLIEKKCRMFDTTFTACSEARVPFSGIFEAKKMLVGFVLNFLHKKNIVMPPLKENQRTKFPGAYVYSSPGYYEFLVSYDYRSMYPSIMMGANVSPETKVTYPINEKISADVLANLVRSPWTANGTKQVFYRRDILGIVPQVTKILFDGRSELKVLKKKCEKEGDIELAEFYDMKQKTYKILGNSLYGLLGNPYFQLYDIDNSASITAFGQKLITSTVKKICNYMDNDMTNDPNFERVFGYKAPINVHLTGTYENEGSTYYNRVSHGDTDSFFVKYSDIYEPYIKYVGKLSEVIVFKGHDIIERYSFEIPAQENKVVIKFDEMCKKYSEKWNSSDITREKKRSLYQDGIVVYNEYRIICNRFLLTDFCRIMDAAIIEDKLEQYMSEYANDWNFYKNTLFLKREKCVNKAIVTAKKKYICKVESNEDIKYFNKAHTELDNHFGLTGVEIVRSSTTPFSRERIMKLIEMMFNKMDKSYIKTEYMKIKNSFFDQINHENYYDIAIPSGVKSDPPVYTEYIMWNDEDKKAVDWRLRSASVWNHLIETDPVLSKMTLEPIFESAKVKYIKVRPNKYCINSIAFVGNTCPKRLLELFIPDWEEQWKKTFADTMDRFFYAVGWGKNLENDERDLMLELL